MSSSVDNRVVSMSFNNKDFESNVGNTLKSLDNLKKGLDLSNSAKGLEAISTSAKRVSLDGISSGIESMKVKFSLLQVVALTALANIANSALTAGKRIMSSLTVDPIKAGFSEYEQGLTAFQTILANTKTAGSTVGDINKTLLTLNDYANKTIYSFGDMTKAIGLFTAQGVNLKDSVTGIKGIFNLVSLTGGDAEKANSAIYQLSQAVASGTVKAQDWISVVNAGIGGTDFQNQLKQTARTHGIAVDDMIKKEGSFKDSLTKGWLTSQVLLETLSQYTGDLGAEQLKSMGYSAKQIAQIQELGKTANDSATKIKSYTQLMDTLQSNVATGWATSFKTVIGALDEASALWTNVGNSIGGALQASSDARNKMLADWKALGGRTILIKAISEAFGEVSNIVKIVSGAFKEIFPPTTGKQLVALTVGLKSLIDMFKLSTTQSADLKSTFKGLFAVLDIGKQIFSAIFNAVGSLFGSMGGLSSGVLGVTASFGDWLVNLDKVIKKSDIFNKVLQPLVSGIKMVVTGFLDLGNAIKETVVKFAEAISKKFNFDIFKAFHSFLELLNKRMSQVSDSATGMKDGITNALMGIGLAFANSKFVQVLGILWKTTKVIVGAVIDLLGKLADKFVSSFAGANFNGILDLISGLSIGGLALGINKFLKNIASPLQGVQGMLGSVTGILDGVRGCFESYQLKLKADVLLKISLAIAILAASIVAISLIDSAKLVVSLGAITTLFGELLLSMSIFTKISGFGIKTMAACTTLIAMATAILILSVAMKNLGDLDWNSLTKGIVGVAALAGILVGTAKLLSSNSGTMIKGSVGMIAFAVAIKILAGACADLSKLSWEQLAKGLVGVGVLMAEISLFLNTAKFSVRSIVTATGIVILAAAIKILASACKDFGDMSWEEIGKGLTSVGLLLAEIMVFTKLTGDAKHVISTGLALVVIAASMKILASALKDFGSMSWDEIGKGLTGMGVALAEVALAMNLMPKNLIFTGTGLAIVAASLNILAGVMIKMASMSWEDLGRSLVAMGGALTILTIALYAMSGTLAGSAALLIAATALAVLTPVLSVLGAMSWESLIKGLIALAGIFVILGVAGLVLTPLIPAILGLSAALVLFGIGITAVGAGLLLIGLGISALAVGFAALATMTAAGATAIVAALTIIVVGVASLIPTILKKIGEGIVALCTVLIESVPLICKTVVTMIKAVIPTLIQCIPLIVNGVLEILSSVLTALIKWVPTILQKVLTLLLSIVQVVIDNIGKFIKAGVDIVVGFIQGISDGLPRIIDAAFKLVISFINGLADAIRNNSAAIIAACDNLIDAIVGGIKQQLFKMVDAGQNIIKGMIEGIGNMANNCANAVVDVATGAFKAALNFLGIHSPSRLFRDQVGVMIGRGMANGIHDSSKDVVSAATKMSEGVFAEAKSWIDDRKYYNDISLEEELYTWQTIQARYKAGTEASLNAAKEVYRVKNEMSQKQYNDETKLIDSKKYYNTLSLEQELAAWQTIQKQYKAGTDERINADKEVYRVKNEMLKKQYSDETGAIDDLKYYNQMNLTQELNAWVKIQKQYKTGTDERKAADREVYRLENEIDAANKSHAQSVLDLETATNEKRKALQDDYYAKTKEINDKLATDIESANKAYEDAIKSRADSLYSAYGLFDAVTKEKPITGATLIKNLQDQTTAFETWKQDLSGLSQKGIGDDLLKELKDMGPKSATQIAALNTMSDSELTSYVALWKTKHDEAKTESISELEDLRLQTVNQISQLNTDAATALNAYNITWSNSMAGLNAEAASQLSALDSEWASKVGVLSLVAQSQFSDLSTKVSTTVTNLRTDTESEFTKLATNIQTIMSTPNWMSVGANIVAGIQQGVTSKGVALAQEVARVALAALNAAKAALGIHSPSTEFAKVGAFAGQGLINGLASYADQVANSAKDLGTGAITAVSKAIAGISDIVSNNIDSEPVIRPVFDLSNIQNGSKQLYSMMDKFDEYSVNGSLKSANGTANSIQKNKTESESTSSQQTDVDKQGTPISFVQNNYSPKALSRIDIYIQTKNQISTMKGLVKPI